MLELRPTCEHCGTELPPDSDQARICTFECTFCARCATWELLGICPNCTGELVARPRRPADRLFNNPGSAVEVRSQIDIAAHQARVIERLHTDDLPPQVWTVGFASDRGGSDHLTGEQSDHLTGEQTDHSIGEQSDGYGEMGDAMEELARVQPGFIGVESARNADGVGITVSRWSSVAAMVHWRGVAAHQDAQREGRARWYRWYRSDVARVDRTAEFRATTDADSPSVRFAG
jgi:uncharacterized protein